MRPMTEGVHAFAENLPGAAFYLSVARDGARGIQFLNSGCGAIWPGDPCAIGADASIFWDMIHPRDAQRVAAIFDHSAETMTLLEARFRITDAVGSEKTLLCRGTPTRLPDGGTRWLTFLFDISAETRTQALFEVVTRQLRYISDAIPDGFALFDADERLVVCNAPFRETYGLDPDRDLRGWRYADILANVLETKTIPDANGRKAEWIADAMARFRAASGKAEERWDAGRWFRMLDRRTEDGGRVTFRIEITQSVEYKRELETAAATDTVTGLLNRRGLGLCLPGLTDALPHGAELDVFHLDLDKFKTINDMHGHEAGDAVLVAVAERLRAQMDAGARVARVGGDEFVIVRPRQPGDVPALTTAEALRNTLREPLRWKGRICQTGASVGVATWRRGGAESLEQALIDADTALTVSKKDGRNRATAFDDWMRQTAMQSASLAAEIKQSIRQRGFFPHFQPQVQYPGGQLVGLEALARWRKPDGTCLPAQAFIDVANETGLITEIDKMVLDQSLDMLQGLTRRGLGRPTVSINLSGLELGRDSVVETLQDAIFTRGLAAQQVTIEILETALLDDRADQIGHNIAQLARAGFTIELDDFGTGHTALTSLTAFPVDRIKIDRSLIRDIDRDAKKHAIVSGLFLVCEKLGIETIAEGVERKAELDTLHQIGLRRFQGYLFARPMAAAALLDWIEGPALPVSVQGAPSSPS